MFGLVRRECPRDLVDCADLWRRASAKRLSTPLAYRLHVGLPHDEADCLQSVVPPLFLISKSVIDADARYVLAKFCTRCLGRSICHRSVRIGELNIEVLGPYAPFRIQRGLDAGSDGPAGFRSIEIDADRASRREDAMHVNIGDCQARGNIGQNVIESIAHPGAHGRDPGTVGAADKCRIGTVRAP
jgi:hypothetical protein